MAQNPAEMAALRTLRLSDEQVAAVRKLVRSRCHDRPGNARRFAYAVQGGIELAVVQIDGHRVVYIVDSVNLSASGVAVLHGNFIHDGTPCEVCLQTTDGEKFAVTGTIVRSECVSAPVHLLGIQFEQSIDIEPFVGCECSRKASRVEAGDQAARAVPFVDDAEVAGETGQLDDVDGVTSSEPASREVAPTAVDAGLEAGLVVEDLAALDQALREMGALIFAEDDVAVIRAGFGEFCRRFNLPINPPETVGIDVGAAAPPAHSR
jgi:hypothetical protein